MLIATVFTVNAQKTVSGVKVDAKLNLEGQSLVLNGAGTRVKMFMDMYVGALYLEKKSANANEIMTSKEGAAIKDFMSPDRVVVGVESEKARELMERLYRPFTLNGYPILVMDVPSAEMTKYAANAMLATRISFMNDIANLCERVGANVDNVRKGMGSDPRIGKHFLYAGCGYGGSCFPKDVKALAHTGIENGYPMRVIEAVEAVNEAQKNIVFEKLLRAFDGDLRGKVIAMWGLSFKPETDDMREAPSLVVIEKLIEAGAVVRAYDPIAMEETHRRIGDKITYCKDMYEAVIDADALALLTEWKQFRVPDFAQMARLLKDRVVFDGRNLYEPAAVARHGLRYESIGRPAAEPLQP